MNPEVSQYIANAPEAHRQILERLRSLIHESVPQLSEEFKWSCPVFRTTKDFAYLKFTKTYVTMGFMQASKLEDVNNQLEGSGKDMRHIKIKNVESIDAALLKKWLVAAAV